MGKQAPPQSHVTSRLGTQMGSRHRKRRYGHLSARQPKVVWNNEVGAADTKALPLCSGEQFTATATLALPLSLVFFPFCPTYIPKTLPPCFGETIHHTTGPGPMGTLSQAPLTHKPKSLPVSAPTDFWPARQGLPPQSGSKSRPLPTIPV